VAVDDQPARPRDQPLDSIQFLSPGALAAIERLVPRSRRLVIDCDGMYSPQARSGSDTNHPGPDSWASWAELYQRLSDTVLQPCLGSPAPGAQRFLYQGVDPERARAAASAAPKEYDLIYVGNNWYRWPDISWLFKGLAAVRAKLGRIAIFGSYWDADHPE